jgi:hypothetical protein
MKAQLKSAEFTPAEARLSTRDDLARVPLIAPQLMVIGELAGHLDLPRRSYWEEAPPLPANREPAPEEARVSGLRRLLGAIGGLLLHNPPPFLSKHLCRDIGIDWRPEPPVQTWPW